MESSSQKPGAVHFIHLWKHPYILSLLVMMKWYRSGYLLWSLFLSSCVVLVCKPSPSASIYHPIIPLPLPAKIFSKNEEQILPWSCTYFHYFQLSAFHPEVSRVLHLISGWVWQMWYGMFCVLKPRFHPKIGDWWVLKRFFLFLNCIHVD